jgi:hypothetical protein
MVVTKQSYLTTHGIKGGLDKWRWIEQLLLLDNDVTQELLAIGQTTPTCSRNHGVELIDILDPSNRLYSRGNSTLYHSAHTTTHTCIGYQQFDIRRHISLGCYSIYKTLHNLSSKKQ